ncbi:BolA protein [Thecamonas trahens ATCC 50062]|uniref:BolA protein n=1 Tax=Thecamonas trahens ATCC 50062 TaxID=461836 RepID=A0A0L0D931_THETB|nr:BolA protein [Thecamonas trahens ATCC 50062]KNC47808.1 BolA protein [Thecamonas trahens ATCC 50062]|eukprot:XP_013759286.1 BolA protein [Thecamonas trahens ATCC 50062]
MAVAPIQAAITAKLTRVLSPVFLDVVNESYKHSVPADAETHFKVTVVSDAFDGLALIERHRKVYDVLGDELKASVHALSIKAKTPAQWEAAGKSISHSTPNCLGGSKADA